MTINKDAHQWDFTKEEKFAIAWFEERGFDVVKVLAQFEKQLELFCALQDLKKRV